MIKIEEITPLMLQKIPNIKDEWDDHVASWNGEERGHYNDMALFAHKIVEDYNSKNTAYFTDLFDWIESVLNHSEQDVIDLVGIGFLESIQTIASDDPNSFKGFQKWFGKTSLDVWYQIMKMWEGKESLGDVVRSERGKNST